MHTAQPLLAFESNQRRDKLTTKNRPSHPMERGLSSHDPGEASFFVFVWLRTITQHSHNYCRDKFCDRKVVGPGWYLCTGQTSGDLCAVRNIYLRKIICTCLFHPVTKWRRVRPKQELSCKGEKRVSPLGTETKVGTKVNKTCRDCSSFGNLLVLVLVFFAFPISFLILILI